MNVTVVSFYKILELGCLNSRSWMEANTLVWIYSVRLPTVLFYMKVSFKTSTNVKATNKNNIITDIYTFISPDENLIYGLKLEWLMTN